jgi:protocatechuate 3,4-dioxygenase beta subunit
MGSTRKLELSRRELFGGAVLLLPLVHCARDARPSAAPADLARVAEANDLGPYYRAGAPSRTTLSDPGEPGDPLHISGRVLGPDGGPLAGALIEVWHADAHGDYDMTAPGKPRDARVFHLRGVLRARPDGAFAVDTITPGLYGARARHVHFFVHSDGYEPFATQAYFPDDARVATDRIAKRANVMPTRAAERGRAARFTMALRRRGTPSPEVLASLAGYEGEYVIRGPGVHVTVVRVGDSLFSKVEGWPDMELFFDAVDRFRVVELDGRGSAVRGPDGKVTAMTVATLGEAPYQLARA